MPRDRWHGSWFPSEFRLSNVVAALDDRFVYAGNARSDPLAARTKIAVGTGFSRAYIVKLRTKWSAKKFWLSGERGISEISSSRICAGIRSANWSFRATAWWIF